MGFDIVVLGLNAGYVNSQGKRRKPCTLGGCALFQRHENGCHLDSSIGQSGDSPQAGERSRAQGFPRARCLQGAPFCGLEVYK